MGEPAVGPGPAVGAVLLPPVRRRAGVIGREGGDAHALHLQHGTSISFAALVWTGRGSSLTTSLTVWDNTGDRAAAVQAVVPANTDAASGAGLLALLTPTTASRRHHTFMPLPAAALAPPPSLPVQHSRDGA